MGHGIIQSIINGTWDNTEYNSWDNTEQESWDNTDHEQSLRGGGNVGIIQASHLMDAILVGFKRCCISHQSVMLKLTNQNATYVFQMYGIEA